MAATCVHELSGGAEVPRRLPWILVGLVIFQGLLGMWTVTWQLKPLVVCAHLLGGMATLSLLLWMWLGDSGNFSGCCRATSAGNERPATVGGPYKSRDDSGHSRDA